VNIWDLKVCPFLVSFIGGSTVAMPMQIWWAYPEVYPGFSGEGGAYLYKPHG